MGKIKAFLISLSGPQAKSAVYQEGMKVEGQVVLDLSEPVKMKGLNLLFHGGAKCHWSEKITTGNAKNKKTKTVHYRNQETYFKQNKKLVEKVDQEDSVTLPEGRHEYPFSFDLPRGLPTSFEGVHGQIRYHLEATVDKPWAVNHVTRRPFTVLGTLDLNRMPECKLGAEDSFEKTICCLCCATGPISVGVRIDRTGFVPGEYIFANAHIKNNSNRRMDAVKLQIVKEVTYLATRKSKRHYSVAAETKCGTLEPQGSKEYTNISVRVPPLPPSGLKGSKIMNIKYTFKFIARPSGPGFDLVIPVDITVGTIPLVDSRAYYLQHTAPQSVTQDDTLDEPPEATYAEVEGETDAATDEGGDTSNAGDADAEETKDEGEVFGETHWAPVYTFYSYGDAPPATATDSGRETPADKNQEMPPVI